MKKLFCFVVAALVLFGCSDQRSNILKVYNWADYIDEELDDIDIEAELIRTIDNIL